MTVFILFFKGKVLENDDQTLSSYEVEKGSSIDLSSSQEIPVVVKTPEGKKVIYEVKMDDKILTLKGIVEEKEGMCVV
jgi:hypothetical protein